MIFFKFPYGRTLYTLDERQTGTSVRFTSFDEQKEECFTGKMTSVSSEELLWGEQFSDQIDQNLPSSVELQQNEYEDLLGSVIDFIKEENLKKLVISRRKVIDYANFFENGQISLTKTFLNLTEAYPNAFVYLFLKESCWIGAFSELLGSFNKETSEFRTMSLAGTLPLEEQWTEKEIQEQKPVTDYVASILEKYSDDLKISETYDHVSGNIKHLRTDFSAQIDASGLENLIAELHPTPAVCGIPKQKCRDAVRRFEDYDREFYAGFIRIETEEEIQYFVNLRCARLYKNGAYLYAGGGITTLSSPKKEWLETELKAQAILNNITA